MSGVNDTHKAAAPGSQRTHSVIVNLIAWAVIAVGSLVLASWVLDIEAGKRLLPGFQSMKFNTALCLVACGLVLWRRAPASASASDPIAAFLALFIFVISGFTLFEYGSGWLLGIDNLVIFDTATAPDNWPGRMSGATALCFSMIGAAWLISMIPMRHSTLILQLFALAVTIVSAAALIGYVFGVREFRLPLFSTMALHTAVLLFLCGLGMLLVRPGEGLMSSATSRYIGGRSLRRLLPFIAVTPILASWLSMQGVLAGHYSDAFGFALSSLSSILVLGFVSWLGADALNCEEERFRSTIDASPVATVMIDQGGIIRIANRLVHSVFRYPDHGLVGLSVEQLLSEPLRQSHEGYRREYMRNPTQRILGVGRELFALRQDGTEFQAEIALNPVQTADGRYVMAAVVDITDRVAAEQKILRLNRMHKVLSGINTLIVRTETRDSLFEGSTRIAVEDGELFAALIVHYDSNLQQCEILHGHTAEEQIETRLLIGLEVDSIRECVQQNRVVVRNNLAGDPGDDDPADLAKLGIRALAAFPLASNSHSPEVALLLCGRESFFFDEPELRLLLEVAGDISFAMANLDKSQELAYLTHFDKVTDLPNRLLLTDRLQQAMLQADSYQGNVSILYMDLDRFKQVNDSFGHAGGDEVLRRVAERIGECVGKADTVSRWGGDEFIVLLPGQSAGDAAGVANAISEALHSLIVLGGSRELFVSCSIGIAEYLHKSSDVDALINSARSAMSTIKEQGGNNYRHFVSGGDQASDDGLELETSLRQALGQKQFQLYYQPQIDIVSGRVLGLEALLRWHHPTQGMIAPNRFIPLAEKTGLIIPIGEWVLREACGQVATQHGLKVAVNLSARQFHQKDLVAMIRRILDETGMPSANLELEITESALIYDVELAIATMEQLNDLGVSVSLDDFGTGYSSLSYLKRFPIDMLKIDKSFIDEVTTDPDSNVIVKTIIVMAHSLGLKVIAEGVETKEQLTMLREHGCDQAQGYLIARPLLCQEALEIAAQTFVVPTS
jgi:diguanylate cyclase (GGDEF)-like protein/PAS domain S-box-containing protein